MIIANPIYDVVFKRLMEDERVARFFISTLLDEPVADVAVRPQEFTYDNPFYGLSLFRLDFIATIHTAEGTYKKVLIEIQKAKDPIDLMRFRKYLGEQYGKEDTVSTASGPVKTSLPIVTIYLLGFTLPDVESAAVKVNRQYTDMLTRQIITGHSDFIEKLTHDCYVVQLPRIRVKLQTRLEQLLSIFEQTGFADDSETTKEYNHPIKDEAVRRMVDILHHAGTTPRERKKIEDEREAFRVFELAVQQKLSKMESEINKQARIVQDQAQILRDKEATLLAQDAALSKKDAAILAQNAALSEKDTALSEKDAALREMARQMEELKRRLGES